MLKWRVRSPLSFLGCETPLHASPSSAPAEVSTLPALASSSFSAPATPVPNRSFLHRAFVPTSPASIGFAEVLGFYDGGLGGKKGPAEDTGPEKVSVPSGSRDGDGGSHCPEGGDDEAQDNQDRAVESRCEGEGQGEGKQATPGQEQDSGKERGKQPTQAETQLQTVELKDSLSCTDHENGSRRHGEDTDAKLSPMKSEKEKDLDSHYSQPRNNKPFTSLETGSLPRPPPSKPLLRYFFGTMDNHISSLRNSNERRTRPNASHVKEGREDRHYAQPRSNKCVHCKKNGNVEEPVTRRVCGVKSLPLTLERKKSKSTFYVDVPDTSSPKMTDRKSEQRNCCCSSGCGRENGDPQDKATEKDSGQKMPIDPSDLYSKPRKRRGKPGKPPNERANATPKQFREPRNDISNHENKSNNPATELLKQCSEPKNLLCDSVSHYSEPSKICTEVIQRQSESVSHYSAPRKHLQEPKNVLVESFSHYSEPRKQSTEPKNHLIELGSNYSEPRKQSTESKNPLIEPRSHYSEPRKTMNDSTNPEPGPRAQPTVGAATQTDSEIFDEARSSKRLEDKPEDEPKRTVEKKVDTRQNVEVHEYEPLDVVRGLENHLDDALDFRDALGYKRAREIRKLKDKLGRKEDEEATKKRKQKKRDKEGKNGSEKGKKGGAKSKDHKMDPPGTSEDPPSTSRRSRRLTRDEIVRRLKSIYRIEPNSSPSSSSSTASPSTPATDKSNDTPSSSSAIRPCYNTFPRQRPRPRPATQTSPLISSESIPDGAYVELFPVLNMSALQLAAEGRDYLMWCPDQHIRSCSRRSGHPGLGRTGADFTRRHGC
ncbi:uncharacterized protein DDB_G0284459-like [Penaeus japonicus]|uniref:uncharacterized protein DDB_G0284459-like n=1 Tax=Penaeus japonicus TaxID=27405 RepID=UPI001C71716E|nr:uncharacterized protein DDB_G0284459-like isoform X1 [Penaeus japonicus]XP_042889019.1 uncharacterized protein DDB_G0284459-like [Penaeus japonicus]XP_042889026.1 uncharacterized protein DDB_G0284459-like [Penaeus japonicus]